MSRSKWVVLGFIVVLLACCGVLPCTQQHIRDDRGWVRSATSLRAIGIALQNYHDVHGKLPPAIVRDPAGRPLYSWRVVLLPYLEQDALAAEFKHDEPWDSLANKPLAEKTPRYYEPVRSGQDRPGLTRYQVLVGPGTAFERDGLSWADFSKGPANTFLVVEAAEPVPWSKPVDLAYDPNGPLPAMQCPYRKPVKYWCWELGSQAGFNATFADGSIRFIPADTDEKTIRQMITRN